MRICFQSVAAGAEEAEKIEEEVNEIEVEIEGTECGQTSVGHRGVGHGHAFDCLGIPGGDSDEDCDAEEGNNPVERGIGPEDVDYHEDNQSEQGHIEERSDARKVACGKVSVDAHGAEHSGTYQECLEKVFLILTVMNVAISEKQQAGNQLLTVNMDNFLFGKRRSFFFAVAVFFSILSVTRSATFPGV